jgi:hypothetical protein
MTARLDRDQVTKVTEQKNVFQSNPLWIRLASRERILLDGGDKIRQPIIYDKLNSNWYSGIDTFDVSRRLTKVPLLFNWNSESLVPLAA